MNDTAATSAVSRTSDSVESSLKARGDDLVDSIGSVLDATVKRGRKVRKGARKRAARELDQRRRQVRRAKKKATRTAARLVDASNLPGRPKRDRSPRKTAVVLGAVALSGALALVLRRKAKVGSPPTPPAAIPTSDVDSKPVGHQNR